MPVWEPTAAGGALPRRSAPAGWTVIMGRRRGWNLPNRMTTDLENKYGNLTKKNLTRFVFHDYSIEPGTCDENFGCKHFFFNKSQKFHTLARWNLENNVTQHQACRVTPNIILAGHEVSIAPLPPPLPPLSVCITFSHRISHSFRPTATPPDLQSSSTDPATLPAFLISLNRRRRGQGHQFPPPPPPPRRRRGCRG